MSVQVAIPVPTSSDPEYNARSLEPYLEALRSAGAEPVPIDLHLSQALVARLVAGCQGVLLPGSRFDVEPERYGEVRERECGPSDPVRTAVDELLLQDAFSQRKPLLGICHGTQSLNVWCGGTLVQDLKTTVEHRTGREVLEAHPVRIEPGARLGVLMAPETRGIVQVNSTHHQAIRVPGDNLFVAAVSPADGVIEAVELNSAEHFVVAVQWHPERIYATSAFARAIFRAFVEAATQWQAGGAVA